MRAEGGSIYEEEATNVLFINEEEDKVESESGLVEGRLFGSGRSRSRSTLQFCTFNKNLSNLFKRLPLDE